METELKLRFLDSSAAQHVFDDPRIIHLLRPETRQRIAMHSLYYDTADHRLNNLRATLRVRRENDQSVMTIKMGETGSIGLHQRLEWNLVIDEQGWQPDLTAGIDAQRFLRDAISDGDPDDALRRVLELIGKEPLMVVCQAQFTRIAYAAEFHHSRMELVLDQGYLEGGSLRSPLLEMELELKQGDVSDLLALGQILKDHLSLEPEPKSKYERCLDLLQKSRAQPFDREM